MPTWPASLPQRPLVDGMVETPPDNKIVTRMAQGPSKVRRRGTGDVRKYRVAFNMTDAQVATFETFYSTTVKHGSLSFDIPHPRTGATISVRIMGSPEYVTVSSNWRVTLELEELP